MKENVQPTSLECPSCGSSHFTKNADGSLICNHCHAVYVLSERAAPKQASGQNSDVLDGLFARVTTDRAKWLQEVRQEASAIKTQEEASSQARLAEMWDTDRRRLEALAQARAERDRQQRILWTITGLIVAAVVVAVLVAIVVALLR